MGHNSSLAISGGYESRQPTSRLFRLSRTHMLLLFQTAVGYALIMATLWAGNAWKRQLFWISAAWFLAWTLVAAWRKGVEATGLRLPPLRVAAVLIGAAAALAMSLMLVASTLGTLHGLFGAHDPLRHAGGYIFWAIVQQFVQQVFFFSRFEELTDNGLLAGFLAAFLFGVAHLPNPVLAPVTFLGGWVLSELFRRYRSIIPLGIGHGLVGLAIALSVPDHIQHHMRVGLSYLRYVH
jgi:hypothetical protein